MAMTNDHFPKTYGHFAVRPRLTALFHQVLSEKLIVVNRVSTRFGPDDGTRYDHMTVIIPQDPIKLTRLDR